MASCVHIDGTAANAQVGEYLHQRLHRIGLVSFAWLEGHLAVSSAGLLGPFDVALGISYTGTTIDLIDALRVARERGATTISVTTTRCPRLRQ
jgi:DNA-binding MurR/RpiR family transcriptional regulator